MEDLKKILKELESIEDSLRGGDSDTASIDLHFLIVELLDKINNDAQYISEVNREKVDNINLFEEMVDKFEKSGRSSILLKIIRDEEQLWITIRFS